MSITIAGHRVCSNSPPMVIAEISGNHKQSLDRALRMVEAAARSGAHAIKLQTFTADTMTLPSSDGAHVVTYKGSPWYGRNLYNLYQEAYTPWEWHQPIFEEAKRLGIGAFSTAFDITAVDFLESIDTEAYKIASFECSDVRLLEAIASTGKPVIVSCGMAHLAEIELAINTLRAGGCQEIALLKCTSSYPADPGESNLKTIVDLKEKFNCEVGLSDHTLGTEVAIGAVALGATLIEKHFTLDKNDGAIDSDFSIEPRELARLVEATKTCWTALGEVSYGPTVSEEDSRRYRRSLYAAEAIQKGQRIQSKNLLSLRPSRGMDSQHINQVIGSRARNTIVAGQPIRKDDILFGSN